MGQNQKTKISAMIQASGGGIIRIMPPPVNHQNITGNDVFT
jgi:hypothetical protein